MGVRRDLVRYYRWLRCYGYNDSHSGNISARGKKGFWITPTGAGADTLHKKDLVACPLEGDLPQGASLDASLHQAVYRARPDVGALIHSHCPFAVAMTFDGGDYTPPDFEGQYYLPTVPVLSIDYASYVAEAPARVAATLTSFRVVIVRGHGVYARGKDLNECYKWTCSLELSAKTAWLVAREAGTVVISGP